ncbi:hypothetical protein H3H36_18720 [Duganella sp. FT3S]|uniref:Uncharacterized protein n=1 Tax=Rugamonas fusca TaxID=2758568 RepID=A0A7W2EK81_9BURK|nr:hypothetical protein [Rugamonas fusca]MBA5607394.1 hypothetical protein [Rugamonas fusca]
MDMHTILVSFNESNYLAVDKVALARTAAALLPLIQPIDAADSYSLDRTLIPLLKSAINYGINNPILDRSEIISGKYFFERREGTLPAAFTSEFNAALSRFLVRAMSMPLDEPKLQTIDGKVWALMEMEEPGDWPDKVRYQ